MAITVSDFTTTFGSVSERQIAALVGKSDYKPTDVIPLTNLASSNNIEFQTYALKHSGNAFLGLFKGQNQVDFARKANFKPSENIMAQNPAFAYSNPFVTRTSNNNDRGLFNSFTMIA